MAEPPIVTTFRSLSMSAPINLGTNPFWVLLKTTSYEFRSVHSFFLINIPRCRRLGRSEKPAIKGHWSSKWLLNSAFASSSFVLHSYRSLMKNVLLPDRDLSFVHRHDTVTVGLSL